MTTEPSSTDRPEAADSVGVAQLAEALGVSRQAVQARVKSGSIRATKVGGVWRIPATVAAALVQGEHTRAVVSGAVTVLAVPAQREPVESGQDVAGLDTRIMELEATVEGLGLYLRGALAEMERHAQARDAEMQELRDDRSRLRRALTALIAEEPS